ncbi:MAG: hypothetical protein L0Y64_00650, partial [Myxococcaceae bacterium]|nr:hypothetical protein [Myxococcaceae bacterium]
MTHPEPPTHPMRYFTQLPGKKESTEVDIEPLAEGRYAVTLNGKRHEIDALALEHGAVTMLIDGSSYSVEFEEAGDEVG